jgi:putative nucleotidyltransferase with HDIG domain
MFPLIAAGGSVVERCWQVARLRANPGAGREFIAIRCDRGAAIARRLGFPDATSEAIHSLDEHWNGRGLPDGLRGDAIPLLARIASLAQTVEVFHRRDGMIAAVATARARAGQWFDPQLVDALLTFRREDSFWARLRSDDLPAELNRWEPQDAAMLADEASLDRVAEAFANVVDAKSPWTYRHSTRVAEITVGVARQFGCPADFERDLRRVALLHDIGKLGVSNLILDKPGRPTDDELTQIRKHPDYSQQILEKVAAFKLLADVAGAHHERLDGRGYHRQLEGDMLSWATRALTVADVCEALTAQRPYREAMPWERARGIMSEQVGSGFDPDCLAALERWYEGSQMQSRVDEQLQEVDRLLAEL